MLHIKTVQVREYHNFIPSKAHGIELIVLHLEDLAPLANVG